MHSNGFSIAGLARDRALRKGDSGRAGNTPYRPHQGYQRRQVIWPHIQHRASTALIEEIGIGMPALWPMTRHAGNCRNWLANPAIINELPAGLQASTQKGIWRAAHKQSPLASQVQYPVRIRAIGGKRLFRIDALASLKRRQGNLSMR